MKKRRRRRRSLEWIWKRNTSRPCCMPRKRRSFQRSASTQNHFILLLLLFRQTASHLFSPMAVYFANPIPRSPSSSLLLSWKSQSTVRTSLTCLNFCLVVWFLGSSQFLLLHQLPQNMMLDSKVIEKFLLIKSSKDFYGLLYKGNRELKTQMHQTIYFYRNWKKVMGSYSTAMTS